MKITDTTRIQDIALFEGDEGALKPSKFTRAEGGELIDWTEFKAGDNVHAFVLDDEVTRWQEHVGFTDLGPAFYAFTCQVDPDAVEPEDDEPTDVSDVVQSYVEDAPAETTAEVAEVANEETAKAE